MFYPWPSDPLCELSVTYVDVSDKVNNNALSDRPKHACLVLIRQGRLHYRVGHLLADLDWVDLDLEYSTIMLGQ